MLLAGIPFWFLPRSLPKQVEGNAKKSQDAHHTEQDLFIPVESKSMPQSEKADPVNMVAMAKGAYSIWLGFFTLPIINQFMVC